MAYLDSLHNETAQVANDCLESLTVLLLLLQLCCHRVQLLRAHVRVSEQVDCKETLGTLEQGRMQMSCMVGPGELVCVVWAGDTAAQLLSCCSNGRYRYMLCKAHLQCGVPK